MRIFIAACLIAGYFDSVILGVAVGLLAWKLTEAIES